MSSEYKPGVTIRQLEAYHVERVLDFIYKCRKHYKTYNAFYEDKFKPYGIPIKDFYKIFKEKELSKDILILLIQYGIL